MTVSLSKGGNVSLEKVAPGMTELTIGLGWDTRVTDGHDFDLDASIFMLDNTGKVTADSDFIFFNNLKSVCGSIIHQGDNLTGEGEGDDESIVIKLPTIPASIVKMAIGVTIHDFEARQQNFGQVSNAFVRVVNNANADEVVRYDLSEDYSTETALIFGEIYRHNNEWKFKAIGQGFNGGLSPMAKEYGVSI
jgi:tellurium resistance protein TerD